MFVLCAKSVKQQEADVWRFWSQTPRSHKSGLGAVGETPVRVEKNSGKSNKNCREIKRRRAAQGARCCTRGKGPILLQFPRPSPPPEAPSEGGSGLAQPLDTITLVDGATSTRRGHFCPGRGVSRHAILLRTSTPSFDRMPRQRRLCGGTSWASCGRSSLPGADSTRCFAPQTPRSKTACHPSFWCSSSSYWVSASS